ncbi:uncharacterized protein LOC141858706 [Brevipalpus obovatus]|uniref:uncharacterized protein LOC141858706 n=1 Tax=Brevipalpus obovatus TaxID=246614 RepID=UPI003D9E6386
MGKSVDQMNSSHDIYEVKEIVGMKKNGNEILYKVRWRGYGPESDTWEREENFYTCHDIIEEFKSKLKSTSTSSRGKNFKNSNSLQSSSSNHHRLTRLSMRNAKTKLLKRGEKSKTFSLASDNRRNKIPKKASRSLINRNCNRNSELDDEINGGRSKKRRDRDSGEENKHPQRRSNGFKSPEEIKSNKDGTTSASEKKSVHDQRADRNLLVHACRVGNIKLVDRLLGAGADRDMRDSQGNTALILASQNGHLEIVKRLLCSGANFAAVNNQGANALRHARIGNSLEIKITLTKHISQITLAMEREVIQLLKSIATIRHALFPIQCHSTVVNLHFRLIFNFFRSEPPESGTGYLLFIGDSSLDMTNKSANMKFDRSCGKISVSLNGSQQRSLTEGTEFVFSLNTLRPGENELVLSMSETKAHCFIICAYAVTLLNANIATARPKTFGTCLF